MVKNIDWGNLGFGYMKTDYRYVSCYKNGKWDEGQLVKDENVVINESACVLQYAQTCFEGLKAYKTKENKVVCFRPDMNAKRMIESAKRLEMPTFSEERFLDAIKKVVNANFDWVPPYGSGASLYIRPYMFGSDAIMGVKPATEYQFRIFVSPVGTGASLYIRPYLFGYSPVMGVKPAQDFMFRIFVSPVGPYFKGGVKPITLMIPDFDRAAPRGTGHVKAGLNYAMSLHAIVNAHNHGYNENLYLDSRTRTKIEETGSANIIFVTKNNEVVTPKSDTILPSITRRSLMYVAEHYLGLKATEREIYLEELQDYKECALCGTAAVLSPVGKISDHGKDILFPSGMEKPGEITQKLYDTLRSIQMCEIDAPEGWIFEVN